MKRLVLPRLYVILDSALLPLPAPDCAAELASVGVRLFQYRDKAASPRQVLQISREIVRGLAPFQASLVVNDRADIAVLAGAAGVHVGRDDLSVESARSIVGPEKWVGVSTHNFEQFRAAASTSADYIAVGPIFPTSSKANPDPVIGVDFIRQIRKLASKPIVAIGGIKLETAPACIEAGADSVAIISDILSAPDRAARARQFLDALAACAPPSTH